jgi:hypothetical protein
VWQNIGPYSASQKKSHFMMCMVTNVIIAELDAMSTFENIFV